MMSRLAGLTRAAEADGAELTVWPESAYPYPLPYAVQHSPYGPRAFLQRGVHGPVISGAYLAKSPGVGTNSSLLVTSDGGISPSSDKRHLLWFGETIPLAAELPILRRIFARGAGLDPGTEIVLLTTGAIRANVLNCYEDTLPIAGREAMTVRPNLLVNVTNDAWFAGTAESELHLRTAVPRAIEERRDLVRAVNRGPTTWVDANGRILARAESPPESGPPPPLMANAALLDAPITLYGRTGEAPMMILLFATALGFVLRARRQTAP
jgi:apolipoprotein N-acyltransferase